MAHLSLRIALVLSALALAQLSEQKAKFKPCKRNQPDDKLNECVKDSIQSAVPKLAKGLPEYRVLPIDPLRVNSLHVPRGGSKAINVDLSFKNLDIIGLSALRVKSVDMNVTKYHLSAVAEVEGPLYLLGNYSIKGKMLVLPIEGKGRCNITIVNPKVEVTELLAKPVTKKGQTFALVTSFKLVVKDVDRVYYHLENLFNGNKQLGDNMNAVLNENWREVYSDMVVPVQLAAQAALRGVVEMLVQKVPYDKIFP